MHYLSALLSFGLPLLAAAAPTRFTRRADADVLVFTFADVLEQLETEFYRQGLAKFKEADFTAAGFTSPQAIIQTLQSIGASESTHSKTLQAALKSFGKEPLTSCKFDFTSALVDVPTMAATARVVENVGVSAYIGGAILLTDPILLAAAGTILSTEARHQTMLNVLAAGTPVPAAFDIAMNPNEILALASPFISGCDLGIKANPSLAITNKGTPAIGTTLTFSSTALNATTDGLFCQMMVGGSEYAIALPLNQCTVPEGIDGPVAIWITSDGQPLLNDIKDRATSQLVAGPTYAFIDSQKDTIGAVLRGQSSGGTPASGETPASPSETPAASAATASPEAPTSPETPTSPAASVTTETVSPSAAQSIIAGAAGGSASAAPAAAPSASSEAKAPASGASNAASGGAIDAPNMFTGKSPDGKTTVIGWL